VAPLRRLHRRQVEDGHVDATDYIGPCFGVCIRGKLKTDGLMRQITSDPASEVASEAS
jgi:hypothetical protein